MSEPALKNEPAHESAHEALREPTEGAAEQAEPALSVAPPPTYQEARQVPRISIHAFWGSNHATWSKASIWKSAPSSRLMTDSTFRLNAAVTP